jgi:hypothetical protein
MRHFPSIVKLLLLVVRGEKGDEAANISYRHMFDIFPGEINYCGAAQFREDPDTAI